LYYAQRATAGLIISEATQVSPFGQGYVHTPGIHTPEQVQGWKKVTSAVHAAGGRIFLQLWHVGRASHQDLQPGGVLPVAPSAIAREGMAPTATGMKRHPVPRALETAEIPGIVAEFRQGAQLAMDAGFDGVEIHGANGYLLDQFLNSNSNIRTDEYGGSIANRARFHLAVTDAVVTVWGRDRVGIRLSPAGTFGDMFDATRWETYSYLVRELNNRQLAYLHFVEPRADERRTTAGEPHPDLGTNRFRPLITGTTRVISAGGHDRLSGEATLASGDADAIAFGRWFISNPDLPLRFAQRAPLNPYDRSTFYGGTAVGYTDYPALESSPELIAC
jgi:N-ethylmaleimide reductase